MFFAYRKADVRQYARRSIVRVNVLFCFEVTAAVAKVLLLCKNSRCFPCNILKFMGLCQLYGYIYINAYLLRKYTVPRLNMLYSMVSACHTNFHAS